MTDEVEVTQADHAALRAYFVERARLAFDGTTAPHADLLLKTLARHRQSAEQQERERIVAWLRAENGLCDCFARSEGECACGAWDDYKRVPLCDLADAIEQGRHRIVSVRAAAMDAMIAGDADLYDAPNPRTPGSD